VIIALNVVAFVFVQRRNSSLEKGDFKMFYTAAVALRSGHSADLYSRELYVSMQRQLVPALPLQDVKLYTHPPYELLVFLPLSYLSYKAACYCWLAITVLLAVLCGRVLPGYAAVLALFPLLATLLEQQDTLLVLLIVIACWISLREDHEAWAGFLLGVALFRFQFVLPLALVLLFWKPRLLKGFVPSAIAVTLLSLAMVGPAGLRSYASYISAMARNSEAAVSQEYKMDPRTDPTIRGLAYELASRGGESMPSATARWLPIAVGLLDLLLLVFAWKFMRSEASNEAKFALAILAGLLLSFHLLMHDLVLLALPFVLLRGWTARWALLPFYVTPLVYWFYPYSQAWLALLLVGSCVLITTHKPENWSALAMSASPKLSDLTPRKADT
jgi:hypothetical protein